MPLTSRAVAALGWALTALSLSAFVYFVSGGRGAPGPAPRWEPARFARLEGAPDRAADPTPGSSRRTWLVAVNLGCPHCRASLPAVVEQARRADPTPALAVLLVDTPERPRADSIATLPVRTVWWDSAAVWRRSWRRSTYGEVLVFDAVGRLVSVRPPEIAP